MRDIENKFNKKISIALARKNNILAGALCLEYIYHQPENIEFRKKFRKIAGQKQNIKNCLNTIKYSIKATYYYYRKQPQLTLIMLEKILTVFPNNVVIRNIVAVIAEKNAWLKLALWQRLEIADRFNKNKIYNLLQVKKLAVICKNIEVAENCIKKLHELGVKTNSEELLKITQLKAIWELEKITQN